MHKKEKINKICPYCKRTNIYKSFWTDYYPEGSRLYDDIICADCGRNINTPQYIKLCENELRNFRIEVGLNKETIEEQNIREFKEFLKNR